MNLFNQKFCWYFIISLAVITTLFTACDKDSEMSGNEQELITTVKLTFSEAGGSSFNFSVKDLDGEGGNPPVAEEIKLIANTAYTISAEFLDESVAGDTKDLTVEVKEEREDHLVCYSKTFASSDLAITDTDGNGKPLGLKSTLTTGAAGTGSLTVSLKHEPDKSSANPCATGETDAEVTFPVKIE
jgi:hypothetical protein